MLMQLGRHFGHPLVLIMVATVPLTTFEVIHTRIEYGAVNAGIFGLLLFGIAFQHAVAARAIGRSAFGAILLSPFVVALAIGLAPTYTVALSYGLLDRAGAFHRTPKVTRIPMQGEPQYRAKRSVLVVTEAVVGLAYAGFMLEALQREFFVNAAFFALISFSFAWMGLGSLYVYAGAPSPRPSV
jgi:hypothetical protein